jgi:hypothetical protein
VSASQASALMLYLPFGCLPPWPKKYILSTFYLLQLRHVVRMNVELYCMKRIASQSDICIKNNHESCWGTPQDIKMTFIRFKLITDHCKCLKLPWAFPRGEGVTELEA